EAPDDPQDHQNGNRITRADMQPGDFVAGQKSTDEEHDKAPVEQPHKRIPHSDRGRRRRAAGLPGHGLSGHQSSSLSASAALPLASPPETITPEVGSTKSSAFLPALSST